MVLQRLITLHADIDLGSRMVDTSPLIDLILPSLLMNPLGHKNQDVNLLGILELA
jgi:hypothetical protein